MGMGLQVTTAASRDAHRRGVPAANFRFAHAETVMPLVSLLGIFDTEGSEKSLEQLYLSQLSAGTSSLLTTMRAALENLRVTQGTGTGCGSESTRPTGKTSSPTACLDDKAWNVILSTGHVPAQILAAIKHPWSTSRVSPMATNIQLEIYDCGDDLNEETAAFFEPRTESKIYGVWARMMHNEKEVHLPPCAPPPASSGMGNEEAHLSGVDRALRAKWRWSSGLAAYNSTHAAILGSFGLDFA